MAFKHKFTYEEKVKIVSEYIDGTYGFREICKRYDINQGSLKDWKRLYETFGWSGLKTGSKTTRYSKETKEAAVRDYLSHEFTFPEILKKYQIRSGTQLKKWIKKYNGCEVLKSSGTGGNNIMTTGRSRDARAGPARHRHRLRRVRDRARGHRAAARQGALRPAAGLDAEHEVARAGLPLRHERPDRQARRRPADGPRPLLGHVRRHRGPAHGGADCTFAVPAVRRRRI